MTRYFSSDWHFGHDTVWTNAKGEQKHRGIITFERTQFDFIEQHDAFLTALIQNWFSKLKPEDEFWFLGDFGDPDMREIMQECPCPSFMVRGNHDRIDNKSFEEVFSKVYDYPIYLSKKLVVSHEPVAVYNDTINVHGHLHGSKLKDKNYINASIHVANYNMISEKQVNNIFSQLPKFTRRFLYEPFAEDYVFMQPKEDVIMDLNGRIDLSASRLLQKLNTEKTH